MKIFMTGATGVIGSAITNELISQGHQVSGLVRSAKNAAKLTSMGGTPVEGDLTNTALLAQEAQQADGVIHLAFMSPAADLAMDPATVDQNAIKAMGDALVGTGKPFITTSAIGELSGTTRQNETNSPAEMTDPVLKAMDRGTSEKLTLSYADRGVRAMVVRPAPSVHEVGVGGFLLSLIQTAKARGESAYVAGDYHWASVHLLDLAHLYVLALFDGQAGHVYHGIAEEVSIQQIATAIGEQLNVPVVEIDGNQAGAHFNWLTPFVSRNIYAESNLTQQALDWQPTHLDLLSDLANPLYYTD